MDSTIIAASLDDKELKSSIDNLVSYVDTKIKEMATNFDNEIKKMEESLRKLGNTKNGDSGVTDSGAMVRTKCNNEETKSVRETTVAYNGRAAATQKAMQASKSAEQSFYAFIQNYREHAAKLANEMKAMPNQSLDKQIAEYQRYEQEIAKVQAKIRELRAQLNEVYKNPNATRMEKKSIADEIARQQEQVKRLTTEQIVSVKRVADTGHAAFLQKQAEYNKTIDLIRQMTTEEQRAATARSGMTAASGGATNRINAQGQAVTSAQQQLTDKKDTIATLRSEIAMLKQEREQMELSGNELKTQNKLIAEKEQLLKRELMSEQQLTEELKKQEDKLERMKARDLKKSQASYTKDWNVANTMSTKNLDAAERKLQALRREQEKMQRSGLFDQEKLNKNQQVIERLEQKIEQMRSKKPKTLDEVMGMNEKSLEAITQKMAALRRVQIDPNNAKQVKDLGDEYQRLKRLQAEMMGMNIQHTKSNNYLAQSFGYIRNRIVYMLTLGAITNFTKQLYEIRAQYELLERSIGVLVGSFAQGSKVFQELNQMALKSPFTLMELGGAAKQLVAYNFEAKEVVNTTRRLADISAALGVPMERLTYNLGQIRAQTVLNARDARDFANAGLPIAKALADYYTELEGKVVSTGEVFDRMKKRAVSYNDVMAVLNKMTDEGGKFFNFQAKQAETLKVQLANLSLAYNNMLNDLGKSHQGLLGAPVKALKVLLENWRSINDLIVSGSIAFGVVKLGQIFYNVFKLKVGWGAAFADAASQGLVGTMYKLKTAFTALVSSPLTWWMLLATAVVSAGMAIYDANENVKEFNKSIRDAAKENYDNISKFLADYSKVRNSLYDTSETPKTPNGAYNYDLLPKKDINQDEAEKAWEAIREQIELSSNASDMYLGKLLQIENVSERVRQGFNVLSDIQAVSAALKELGDNGIKVTQNYSAWWNSWMLPEGLIENLKDYTKAQQGATSALDDWQQKLGSALIPGGSSLYMLFENDTPAQALAKLRDDLEETTQSILNFINLKGWSGDVNKINETFAQVAQQLATQNNLSPQDAYNLQMQLEEAKTQAVVEAYTKRIADEQAALVRANDENAKAEIQSRLDALNTEFNFFKNNTAESRVVWAHFTKWLKEEHISEVTQMFHTTDAEQLASLVRQGGQYSDWINRMVNQFQSEHKGAYHNVFETLRNYVNNANQWSIFLKLTISTEDGKSIYDVLSSADQALESALSKLERLKKRREALIKQGANQAGHRLWGEYQALEKEMADLDREIKEQREKGGVSKSEETQAAKDAKQAEQERTRQAKQAAAAQNRAHRQAVAAERQAESELQKTINNQLSLIDKVRNNYKKLVSEGVSPQDAIKVATQGFTKSVEEINKVFAKWNVEPFDLTKYAGVSNPKAIQDMMQKQLDAIIKTGKAKPKEIQSLQVKIKDLSIDATSFNQKTLVDSLNNKLSQLKEEYDLALTLDADPEIGQVFADMIGFPIETLPRTVKEYSDLYTKYLNEYFRQNNTNIELPHLNLTKDDLAVYEEMVKAGTLSQDAYQKIAQAVSDVRAKEKKDLEDVAKEWNKILEKFSEYEVKVRRVENEAAKQRTTLISKFGKEYEAQAVMLETKIAAEHDPAKRMQLIQELKNLAAQVSQTNDVAIQMRVAIDQKETQEVAHLAFEEFQKSPEWIIATGDVAGMTHNALSTLIKTLEDYKKKSKKNLNSKDLTKLNKVIKQLHKEIRKNNPFHALSDAMEKAKDRADEFNDAIQEIESKISNLENLAEVRDLTEEEAEELDKLRKQLKAIKKEQKEVSKIDPEAFVGELQNDLNNISKIVDAAHEMAEAFGGKGMTKAAANLQEVMGVLDKTAEYAGMGASIGGGYGAIAGAVVGLATGIAQAAREHRNASIDRKLRDSNIAVKRLEQSFKNLERSIDSAFGAANVGLKQMTIANKELQLAEIKRQIELEKSRKSKDRDKEKIVELEGQYDDLKNEIEDMKNDITNSFLGISSVSSAVEDVVNDMVNAIRNGEDAIKSIKENINDMIASMVTNVAAARVIGPIFEGVLNGIEEDVENRGRNYAQKLEKLKQDYSNVVNDDKGWYFWQDENGNLHYTTNVNEYMEALGTRYIGGDHPRSNTSNKAITYEEFLALLQKQMTEAEEGLSTATKFTMDDVRTYAVALRGASPEVEAFVEELQNILTELGLIKDTASDTALSNLQQGIQGVTEDTAGALEAYMNIVSQRVFEQNQYLMEIRDHIIGLNLDIQLGTLAQMLLQLQQSYTVQLAIQSILTGALNPSGRAFAVELVA